MSLFTEQAIFGLIGIILGATLRHLYASRQLKKQREYHIQNLENQRECRKQDAAKYLVGKIYLHVKNLCRHIEDFKEAYQWKSEDMYFRSRTVPSMNPSYFRNLLDGINDISLLSLDWHTEWNDCATKYDDFIIHYSMLVDSGGLKNIKTHIEPHKSKLLSLRASLIRTLNSTKKHLSEDDLPKLIELLKDVEHADI